MPCGVGAPLNRFAFISLGEDVKGAERHAVFSLLEVDVTQISAGIYGPREEKEKVWQREVHARHGLASG
jgi:hypothetical protein